MKWNRDRSLRFLTFTSAPDSVDLPRHFRMLVSRIRRLSVMRLLRMGYIEREDIRRLYPGRALLAPFNFDYMRIRTSEGHGVLHIVVNCPYIPQRYLRDIWEKLHGAWNVNIQLIKKNHRMSSYLVNQYLSDQKGALEHYSWSPGWVHRGWVRRWRLLVRTLGLASAILAWDYICEKRILPQKQTSLTDYG